MLAAVQPTTTWYLLLSAVLFSIGTSACWCGATRWSCSCAVELMLNAVNLSFVVFSRSFGDIKGQTAVFFVLVVAAAEVVVGLGIIVAIFRKRPGANADDIAVMKG